MAAEPRATEKTILAFDFGTRKIGVAVGNTAMRIAHPLTTVQGDTSASRFAAIATLIGEWRPDALLVGRPVHADGADHRMSQKSDQFARMLGERFTLPVLRADERFTTREATAALAGVPGTRVSQRKEARDAVAAQLILQTWFDATPHPDDARAAS